uniref:Uncharacterized protein n=1 Tax=Panagrolaimus sp. ES5 TaxID=591445 RepID=A0AC34GAL8_9BILA
MGTEDAVNGGTGVDGSGCSTLLAICPENPNPGLFVFMQFNGGQGGPTNDI